MGVKRKPYSAEFKARVAMASLSGEKTRAQLSVEFGVHPTMISNWKQELVKRAGGLFARGGKAPAAEDGQKVIDDLHRQIASTVCACAARLSKPLRMSVMPAASHTRVPAGRVFIAAGRSPVAVSRR